MFIIATNRVNSVSKISLHGSSYMDATLVSNRFIDYYMTNANESQIKIYLYLLRCIGSNQNISVCSIADRFNYTEKDILRALMYWDRESLISLEFDSDNNVMGICLNDILNNTIKSLDTVSSKATESPITEEAPVVAKPFYSLDKMNEFKSREEVKQLIFMTEHYMGKTLSLPDTNTLLYLYEELHFPVDLIEYLIEYCVNNNHKSMRYIEKTAFAWADQDIHTVKAAKANTNRFKKEYFAVLKAFGISGRNPVDSDIDYIRRWTSEYGFDMDIIIEACNRTMKAIAKPSFGYADSILKNWKEKNVHHKSDVQELDENFQRAKTTPVPASTVAKNNKFKNFTERDCDFDEIAMDLLRN